MIKKDFRIHYKCAFKKILESYQFWLTEVVMFNSGEHTNYLDILYNTVYCTNMSFPRAKVS